MRSLLLVLAVAPPAHAQAPKPTALPEWRIPIHTAPDDPVGGAYGVWAAGTDYKVSFHDGFTFYPVLGKSYPENLPLRWTTESITIGRETLVEADTPARVIHTDWRFERHYPGVVEAYDVRRDGVEQTFTLTDRPAAAGDVVVTGRFETKLVAADRAAQHDKVVFRDDRGNAVVEYGAAVAIDATGQRRDMLTELSDGEVRLTLDAAWLDRAAYPVTVDPVTSTVAFPTGGAIIHADVVHGESNSMLVVESRRITQQDWDARGYLVENDFSNPSLVFTDLSAQWGTQCWVAYVGGAQYGPPAADVGRFVVALERAFLPLVPAARTSSVRAYVHDRGNTVLNSGTLLFLPTPAEMEDTLPSIGGTPAGTSGENALITFLRRPLSGPPSEELFSVLVDAGPTPAFGTPQKVAGGGPVRVFFPSMARSSDGGTSPWVLIWQTIDLSSGDEGIDAARVGHDGMPQATANIVADTLPDARYELPLVDGRHGRFLAAWQVENYVGMPYSLEVRRFDWPSASSPPVLHPVRQLVPPNESRPLPYGGWHAVAYDSNTRSHWVVAHDEPDHGNLVVVERLGFASGSLESVTVAGPPLPSLDSGTAICFNAETQEFPLVWERYDSFLQTANTLGARLQYDPNAGSTLYGSGCAGTISVSNAGLSIPPYTGSEFLRIHLDGGLGRATSILAMSASPASIPLNTGCFLNLGAPIFNLGARMTLNNGDTSFGPFAMPDDPIFFIDLYWQWIQIDPTTNGVSTTQGLITSHR